MELVEKDLLKQRIEEGLSSIDFTSDINDETKEKVKVISTLIPLLTEMEAQESKEFHDREMERIERDKQKIGFSKAFLEVLKVAIPTVIPLMIWRVSFKEMVKFEETGRFVSTASKELHLPKIFK